MALIPKIELTALSDNADSFFLKDITGIQSVSNPGGYNGTNIPVELVDSLLIQLFNEGNETAILSYIPASKTPFLDGIDAQEITVANFGAAGYLTDGVLHVKYYTLLSTKSLSSVDEDGLAINSNEQFRSNETVVVVDNVVYRVDTEANNTPSKLYLLDAIATSVTQVKPGYAGEGTILNIKHLESELAKKIASFAGQCGCNDKQVMDLTKMLLKKLGIPVRYNCSDYHGAQQIIFTLTNDLKGECSC